MLPGGAVRIDVSLRYRIDAYSSSSTAQHRWYAELYRDATLIKKFDWLPWESFVLQNAVLWVNYAGMLPTVVDKPGPGTYTYSVKVFSFGVEQNITFNESTGLGFESSISIMEIKK